VWVLQIYFQKVWGKVWDDRYKKITHSGQGREFMKKRLLGIISLIGITLGLSGCSSVGDEAASRSIIYGGAAVLSALLLIGCLFLVRKNRQWFVLLFSSVLVVNIGYTILSVSSGLEMALWANRVSYLGSVFLPLAMLMIILNITNTRTKRWVPVSLFSLAVVVFLIAASPGILPIYYKEVSFEIINGVSTLVKVYGPLHPLYLVYLLGYFSAMIAVIIRASIKKTFDSTAHAVIIAMAVFVNIGVWFIEQISSIDFEFLSVSYIITELFLCGVHMVMNENQRLRELVQQKEEALRTTSADDSRSDHVVSSEMMECFAQGLDTLTSQERQIYEAYLSGTSTKDIMIELNIKENTLKFHNKNLYSKLGVSSRKQLLKVYRAIQSDMKKNGDKANVVI
jgi:DNA-binding CsgD family transcriptional regulator